VCLTITSLLLLQEVESRKGEFKKDQGQLKREKTKRADASTVMKRAKL
jgi:hypothetical protein